MKQGSSSIVLCSVIGWVFAALVLFDDKPALPVSNPTPFPTTIEAAQARSSDVIGSEADGLSVDSITVTSSHKIPLVSLKQLAGDPKVGKGQFAVRVPVFMFHHVRQVRANDTAAQRAYIMRPEVFERQMKNLFDAGYVTVTPDDLTAAVNTGVDILPAKPLILTFDDGFREHYTTVYPILKKYNFKATFFIVTNATRLSGYMTKDMLKEVSDSGLITIASHTVSHPFLTRLSVASREKELRESKAELEEITGKPVNHFAYPYGSRNATVLKEAKEAGYTSAFGVRLGSLHATSTRYDWRRIRVQDGEDLTAIAKTFSNK